MTNHEVNSLLLNWTAIPSQEARGIVVGYRIYYRPYYSNQTFNVVQTNASTFKIKLDNLEEATLYAIMVGGLTLKGEGLYCFLSESTCKYSLPLSQSLSLSLSVSLFLSVCWCVCFSLCFSKYKVQTPDCARCINDGLRRQKIIEDLYLHCSLWPTAILININPRFLNYPQNLPIIHILFSVSFQWINKTSGELTSPGYPRYIRSADMEWIIHSFIRNGAILLIFDPFDVPPSVNCRYCLWTVST